MNKIEEQSITWVSNRVDNIMDLSDKIGIKNFILIISFVYLIMINVLIYFYL